MFFINLTEGNMFDVRKRLGYINHATIMVMLKCNVIIKQSNKDLRYDPPRGISSLRETSTGSVRFSRCPVTSASAIRTKLLLTTIDRMFTHKQMNEPRSCCELMAMK